MLTKINQKLDEVIGLLMDRRKPVNISVQPPHILPASPVNPNEEHAAQIAQILRELSTFEQRSRQAAIVSAQLLHAMGEKLERLESMSQALLDAVATMAANVQTLTDTVAAHDTEVSAGIAALQAALSANPVSSQDPDIARAIDQLASLSGSVKTTADKINTETQAIAAAIAPSSAATPTPPPVTEPPATDAGPNPSAPAGS